MEEENTMQHVAQRLDSDDVTPCVVEDVNKLLTDLSQSARRASQEDLYYVARHHHLFVVRIGMDIAGMATLILFRKPTGFVGHVEDVVVGSEFRNLGIGRALMYAMIHVAHACGVEKLELTSGHHRVAAHKLYESLGFVERATKNFTLSF